MIKSTRYIIKKIIIGVLIGVCLFYFKSCSVHAEVFNLNAWVNNTYLKPGIFVGANGHTVHVRVDYIGYPVGVTDPNELWYVSLAVCRTWADSGITYTQSGTASSSFNIQNTQIPCPFSNSPYNLTGFLSIITYKQTGGGAYNNAQFDIYTVQNTSGTYYSDIQFVDLSVDINKFKTVYDYADLGNQVNANNMINSLNSLNTNISSLNQSLINKMTDIYNNANNNQAQTNAWLQKVEAAAKELNSTMKNDDIDTNDQDSKINSIKNSGYNNASISDIILLPVNLLSKLVDGLSSNSCSSYNLGNFYGTDLVFTCISSNDLNGWLGSTLYGLIDILMSFCVILGIRKFVIKVYNTIIFLKEGGNTVD